MEVMTKAKPLGLIMSWGAPDNLSKNSQFAIEAIVTPISLGYMKVYWLKHPERLASEEYRYEYP